MPISVYFLRIHSVSFHNPFIKLSTFPFLLSPNLSLRKLITYCLFLQTCFSSTFGLLKLAFSVSTIFSSFASSMPETQIPFFWLWNAILKIHHKAFAILEIDEHLEFFYIGVWIILPYSLNMVVSILSLHGKRVLLFYIPNNCFWKQLHSAKGFQFSLSSATQFSILVAAELVDGHLPQCLSSLS